MAQSSESSLVRPNSSQFQSVHTHSFLFTRYHTLWIPATNLHAQSRRFFVKPKTRLKLIRRTLQQQTSLAAYVREIQIVDYPATSKAGSRNVKTCCDSLASIVSACPQLERITGFYPTYHKKHDSIFRAISAKQTLKEHTWILCAREKPKAEEKRFLRSSSFWTPREYDPAIAFVELHSRFENLERRWLSPVLQMVAPIRISPIFFKHLPALQNLHLGSFASHDFEPSHLKYLPKKA